MDKKLLPICKNCKYIAGGLDCINYIQEFPSSSKDWLLQLDKEVNCCDKPEFHYEYV